jgi:hypothetical protein
MEHFLRGRLFEHDVRKPGQVPTHVLFGRMCVHPNNQLSRITLRSEQRFTTHVTAVDVHEENSAGVEAPLQCIPYPDVADAVHNERFARQPVRGATDHGIAERHWIGRKVLTELLQEDARRFSYSSTLPSRLQTDIVGEAYAPGAKVVGERSGKTRFPACYATCESNHWAVHRERRLKYLTRGH